MHSSFAKTLNDVKNIDGSLMNAINISHKSISNPASVLMGRSKTHKSPLREGSENKKLTGASQIRKHTPSRFYRNFNVDPDSDRYIPNRQAMDMSKAQFILSQSSLVGESINESHNGSQVCVSDSNQPNQSTEDRILEYRIKRPTAPFKEISNAIKRTSPRKNNRFIPNKPIKILDAPDIIDDYYLNIMDWSSQFVLAIALHREVYIWNSISGTIKLLLSLDFDDGYVTSLRWSPSDPNVLAVGKYEGGVQLWDANEGTLVRTMNFSGTNSTARVPAIAWSKHIVSSGSRTGEIRQHDVRISNHEVGFCNTHTQEVCSLQWSPDDRYLASGANDNLACVFSASEVCKTSGVVPHQQLNDHIAAVKAIAWCPWKPALLATGGGSADHHLRFWNINTGSCIQSTDVETQVSAVLWNQEYRELISSHGNGNIALWKYPSIQKIKDLSDHTERILSMVASPDGEMVASCSADETVRIWNCFQIDEAKKRENKLKQLPSFSLPRPMR